MVESPRILYHHRTRAFDGQAVHIQEMLRAFDRVGVPCLEVALVLQKERGEEEGGRAGFWRGLRLPRLLVEILERGYDRRGVAMLRRAAASFRPDLLYERQALHCRAGMRAARVLDLPWFLEVNAPLVDEMTALGLLRFPKAARNWNREVLASADRVFTVTRVLAERCLEVGAPPDRLRVVPNGADLEAFRDLEARSSAWREEARARGWIPEEAFLLGFVGFPRAWHRLEHALEAMAALRTSYPDLFLLILGEGPAVPGLCRRARALGLGDRLHVTGALPRREVPPIVGAMDLVLIPAINPYASPLKLLDAMAAGVPALAPDQPNLRELVEHERHAFLFKPGEQGFRRVLEAVLGDREGARRVGAAGRARIDELGLTWEENARRVLRAYAELGGG